MRHGCLCLSSPPIIALASRRSTSQTAVGPTLQEVGELDGICTYCEMAVPLVSRLAERFGLPGNRCAQPGALRQPRLIHAGSLAAVESHPHTLHGATVASLLPT